MSTRDKLDNLIHRADTRREPETEITLAELSGKTERELSLMSEAALAEISEQAVQKMRDMAVEQQKILKMTWTDQDGKKQELKIVPATLDNSKANLLNDGDKLANFYHNGKQKSWKATKWLVKNSGKGLLKGIEKGAKGTIRSAEKWKQSVLGADRKAQEIAREAMSEFGR